MAQQFLECQLTAISSATTTSIVPVGKKVFLHTISCPKATTGTVTVTDAGSPTTYFVLPAASIGSFILDIALPNGLKVVTSAGDTVLVTWMQ